MNTKAAAILGFWIVIATLIITFVPYFVPNHLVESQMNATVQENQVGHYTLVQLHTDDTRPTMLDTKTGVLWVLSDENVLIDKFKLTLHTVRKWVSYSDTP